MADVSVRFPDKDLYQQVEFQRGVVVLDGELNFAQRTDRIRAQRTRYADTFTAFRNEGDPGGGGDGKQHQVPTFKNIVVDSTGTETVRVRVRNTAHPGIISAWGYTFELTGDVEMPTVPNTTGGGAYQQLYFTIEEEEVPSATDPDIKVDELDETAIRIGVKLTWVVGAENTDHGPIEWDNSLGFEPWNGGKASFLVANIQREDGGGPIVDYQVQPQFKISADSQRVVDRFFSGLVRMHGSLDRGGGGVGSAYAAGANLIISNLSVHIGAEETGVDTGSVNLAVYIDGTYNLSAGEALIAVVPNLTANAAREAGIDKYEFIGVVTDEPKHNEVRLIITNLSFLLNGSSGRDQNFDNFLVIAQKMSDSTEFPAAGPQGDTHIVFADGQRIFFKTEGRADVPDEGKVYWGYGNTWFETHSFDSHTTSAAVPAPNFLTDVTPRYRSYLAPSLESLSLHSSQNLRNVANSAGMQVRSGTLIRERVYYARLWKIKFDGTDIPFTGKVETVNARWDPGPDPANPDPTTNGMWHADDGNRSATVRYIGFEDDVAETEGLMTINGFATHAAQEAATWTRDHWLDGSGGGSGAIHTLIDGNGSQRYYNQLNGDTVLSNYRRVEYSAPSGSQPVRAVGVTPAVNRAHHYACMRPQAYCQIYTDGNGGVLLLNGALNIDTVTMVDQGAGDSNLKAYLIFTLKTIPANPINVYPIAQLIYGATDNDQAAGHLSNVVNFRHALLPRVQNDGTIELDFSSDGEFPDDVQRGFAINKYAASFIVWGGW